MIFYYEQIRRIIRFILAYRIATLDNFFSNEIFNVIPFHSIRLFAYRQLLGVKIGKDSSIGMHSILNYPSRIRIGSNCAIGQYVYLDGRGGLKIGSNVNIAGRCSIYTASHNHKSPKWEYLEKAVVIENDVWVASNSVIIQGIHIGRGAIIAAGSVVVKDVKDFEIVGGNPARKIGERPSEIAYKTRYFPLLY